MDEEIEIIGRVTGYMKMFKHKVYQIEETNSRSYYVILTGKPSPRLNSEIQICAKPVHIFQLENLKMLLYKEIN